MSAEATESLGATYLGQGRCRFLVWAPWAERVEVHILTSPQRQVPLAPAEQGYHRAVLEGVSPGTLYRYVLDGEKERPDPASRFQPQGVHGPSAVVDASAFAWEDTSWAGLPLEEFILYELHVGTFTPEGTFDAVIPHLDRLAELGVTAVELMPVAQFPGERNWGYDGVFPFAVQASYGGPDALKRLVNACHRRGLAAVLDVVYNHLGPQGNYLADFGPYFSQRYHTPWGSALNFDAAQSDDVRRFFLDNALYWLTEFHFDALRLDAIHGIFDASAYSFLAELGDAVHQAAAQLGRPLYVIPESDLNEARVVQPRERGGYGLDAQWNDDFHHVLHTLLTRERNGYYQDFGRLAQLATAFREGFVYSGQYSAYRQRRHGNSSRDVPAYRFVVFAQNHDQVGNRMRGDRLSALVDFEALKLIAGVVLLSPFLPLLFMGEEYGETAPFQYFVSHSDPELIAAVRKGRREEFARFRWQGELPDPQDEATFLRSKLRHERRRQEPHQQLENFHRELIRLRRERPALRHLSQQEMEVTADEEKNTLLVRRWHGQDESLALFHFGQQATTLEANVPRGRWHKRLDSAERHWSGPGSSLPTEFDSSGKVSLKLNPHAVALYQRPERA